MANKSIFADAQNGLLRNLKPLDLIGFMQILFDKYEEAEIAKFTPMMVDRYFTYNPIQMGLTAEALMGQYNFRVMATVLGPDSTTPLRGTTGFSAWTHEIPRIGHRYPMEASRLRQLYQVLESVRTTDAAKIRQLQNTIFNNSQDAYLGCKDTLDYIFLHSIFHEGVVEFTTTFNNPQGPASYMIDYLMPDENKKVSSVEWTDANAAAGNLLIFEWLQDIVQESFIKAYRAMESFRGESAFYTWLYRITVNTAKNFVVKNAGRGISVDVDTPDIEAYDGSERLHQGDNPENILESSDVKRVIKEALQSLPDDLRQAITLREIDDMSYDEIADVMGCPVGTVKSRISRAREIINRKLTESGERLNSKA